MKELSKQEIPLGRCEHLSRALQFCKMLNCIFGSLGFHFTDYFEEQ